MKWTRNTPRPVLLALALSVLTSWGLASPPVTHSASSLVVALTGTLLPSHTQDVPDGYAVSFQGRTWVFSVSNVDVLNSSFTRGSAGVILGDMGPRRLRLLGDEAVLASLLESAEGCRPIRIQGTLYGSIRTLKVGSVEEVEDAGGPHPMCPGPGA